MPEDVTILAAGIADVPETYTVPPLQAITPKAVNATIDGTSASGDFVPTLEILNDAGIVIARCVDTSQTVAAGGSAEVSWFPGVVSAASAATTPDQVAYVWGVNGGSVSVAGSGGSAQVPWAHFQSTDDTVIGTDTAIVPTPPFNNSAGDIYVCCFEQGLYLVAGAVTFANGTYAQRVTVDNPGSQYVLNAGLTHYMIDELIATTTGPAPPSASGAYSPSSYRMFYVDSTTAPMTCSLLCYNGDTVSHNVTQANMGVFYWPDSADLTFIY